MFRHSLLITYRNFKKYKSSFFINLAGLSTGMACVLLIFLWVRDEMNVDKFHENDSRLYQVMWSTKVNGSGDFETGTHTAGPLADALLQEIPGIEKAVTVAASYKMNTLSFGEKALKAKAIYADQDFFEIFSFNLVDGQKESVLADRSNIVISEELAMNLFGTTKNIIGKVLTFDHKEQFTISGVVEKIPSNSGIQFDFALLLPLYEQHTGLELSWGERVTSTYLLLNNHMGLDQLNTKILRYLIEDEVNIERTRLFARPFSDGYLYGNYVNGIQNGGRIDYVKLFVIIGIIILLIACINFISLSTAKATDRMKEVGIKKVLGANRKSIIFQHLGESVSLAFLSLFLSLFLVFLLLPSFNELADKQMALSFSFDTVLAFFTITLFTGILSGIYPAFYISGFKPVMILKSNSINLLGGKGIRNALVVTQFSISVILIIFTIVVYSQFSMIQNRNLGYSKDNVIYFDLEGKVTDHRETFLAELRKIPGVQKATSAFLFRDGFLGEYQKTNWMDWPGKDPEDRVLMDYRTVDYDMIELLGMEMKSGRSFFKEFSNESLEVIFNEAAIKQMGLKNPIGNVVKIWNIDFEIIGVVKDFFIQSIHGGKVEPMILVRLQNQGFGALNTVMVKVNGGRLEETLSAIEEYHSEFNPGFPYSYHFLDQDFQKQYASEKRLSVLSRYFAGLAIIISCLGIFGLTAFTVNKRKKELSIRKVLGASGWQTIILLYRDVSKLVLVALLLGIPTGYFLTSKWLAGFAERIALAPWIFIVSGGLSFSLMVISSGFQIMKVLSLNPAESLRKE